MSQMAELKLAGEITRLQERIEELKGLLASQHSQDFEALQDRCFDLDAKLAEYVKKKRELEAENKRLREALEVAPKPVKNESKPGWFDLPEFDPPDRRDYVCWYVNLRRKALEGE